MTVQDCKMNLFADTPCAPVAKSTGRIEFSESTPFYADNNLGDGAVITIILKDSYRQVFKQRVWLTWIDWNEFEYESVGW